MSYVKNEWKDGDEITASKLNHMENGIHEAAESSGSGTAGFTTILGSEIDDIKKFWLDIVLYARYDGYKHAPFDYGLIITHDYPDMAFFDGPTFEQLALSLDVETRGKCYARTVAPHGDSEADFTYTPTADDWREVSYTKDEIDVLFGNVTTDIDLTTCTTVTSGTADIAAKAITPATDDLSQSANFEIDVSGYVEIEATVNINMGELIINGESYVAEPGAPLVYSGNITGPISGYVSLGTLTFDKFVKGKPLDERVEAVEQQVGNVDAALDEILAIQESLINGTAEAATSEESEGGAEA